MIHRAQLSPPPPRKRKARHKNPQRLRAAATMAAAIRLLLRQHAAAPPYPMLRSLFPAPYSKVRWKQFRCLILLKPSPRLVALTSLPSPGRRHPPRHAPCAPAASSSEGSYSKEGSSNSKGIIFALRVSDPPKSTEIAGRFPELGELEGIGTGRFDILAFISSSRFKH